MEDHLRIRTAVFLSFSLATAAFAATPPALQHFDVRRANGPIHIDGVLDEPAWQAATVIAVDKEWTPGDNTPAIVRTNCLVTFDEKNLYVAFHAADPRPREIRAHITDRDGTNAFADDTVGFMVDPFNDQRRAFQFRINAAGVQMDATNSDVDGSEDWSWDAIWSSAARVTATGYDVEAAVPFKQLRFPPAEAPQTWGFLAFRDYPRSLRYRMRSMHTSRDRSCLICQFDKLAGFVGIQPGRNIELDPTLTSHRTDNRNDFPDGAMQSGDLKLDPGISGRWGITSNVTLSAALNPDFSQVEADAAQLDVNTRFALFYPEKRPFFLEGADFFSTPLTTVFTRTVSDPSFGAKVTGKSGANAFGVFVARDEINNLILPSNQSSDLASIDQPVKDAVVRYRRDLGATSTIGVTVTDRQSDGYFNRLAGVDGHVQFHDTETVTFHFASTRTDYPSTLADAFDLNASPFSGTGAYAGYNHNGRLWQWVAEGEDLSRGYRADFGFEPQVDVRYEHGQISRTFWGSAKKWYSKITLLASADRSTDHNGLLTASGQDYQVAYFGPKQSFVRLTISPNLEYFDGRTYNNPRQSLAFQIRPNKVLSFAFVARHGDTIDFVNSRKAHFYGLNPSVTLQLRNDIEATLEETHERDTVALGHLFTADLTQLRLVYYLNLRSFVRLIEQYTDVTRNPDAYMDDVNARSKRLFTQLLFSYKLNPQSVVLVGYSDNYSGLQNEIDRIPLTQTSRTLFVKFGYAWSL